MKAKWLLALAGLFVLFFNSCDPTEELEESISISPSDTSYTFPVEGGQYVIELTATLDWALQGYDDDVAAWLSITPTSGSGSSTAQTITIEALENEGYSRSASITFYGNILNNVTVTFTQEGAFVVEEGDGTAESPYSVAQALALIASEGWYSTTDGGTYSDEVYVKGIISTITEVSPTYGNATYLISDDGTTSNELTVYRGYYLNSARFTSEDQIQLGDEVVVAGQLTLFYSTYEFTTGNYIYSLNGEIGDGSADQGPTSAEAVTIAEFLEKEVSATVWYELTGTITSITGTSYGNFYMEDSTGSVYVYGLVAEYANGSNDQSFSSIGLAVGDEVTIWTLRSEYNGSAQAGGNNPAIYRSHTPGSGDPGSGEGPTSAEAVTIAEFLAAEVSTTVWYELTGTITSIVNTNYGNFYMEDSTGSVYVYGLVAEYANGSNDQSFSSIGLSVGDEVTIWTLRAEYYGSAQAGGDNPAIYRSHTSGSDPVYPDGTVTLTFPDDNSDSNGVSNYTTTWEAKSGDYTWDIYAFNNNNWNSNWTHIRCGRNGNASVATITTTTPIPATVESVEITFDQATASSVNSIYLSVYSDADCTEQVGSNIELSDISAGTKSLEIPAASRGANQYYKLTFDCASGSANGFVRVSKLVYLAAE